MQRAAIAILLMLGAGSAQAQLAGNCAAMSASQVGGGSGIAPIAPEMATLGHQLGAPAGVLAEALDESMSVEQVLFRIRLAGCDNVASVTPAPSPGTMPALQPGTTLPAGTVIDPTAASVPGTMPSAADPAAYKPRTEFDNSPWRFDMNQNGKRMTADEFTAWMQSKGVRVAKGAPGAAVVVPAAAVLPGAIVPVAAPEPTDATVTDPDLD